MSENLENALKTMSSRVGEQTSQSEWFEVTQQRINDYADVSMDHQWIHVDVDRANKESPFGAPIAHGNLTLAIMGHLPMASVAEGPKIEGQKLGINYGFDRIRFPSPVPVGTKLRATSTLKRVEIKGEMLETMNEIVVEAQGTEKPVCVAESLGRMVF
ncbi:MAG: MaoC family dehydratase [Gammaproteobacteria bacterium]|jgi:acyl dehydratase|nr:MaoC family dehydratase [Gammaproteobacteria bacterium]|tara:strand:+ start:540 stop:1013 length:474 start_codon:yes stop_codon:yes gene_type:complete